MSETNYGVSMAPPQAPLITQHQYHSNPQNNSYKHKRQNEIEINLK